MDIHREHPLQQIGPRVARTWPGREKESRSLERSKSRDVATKVLQE